MADSDAILWVLVGTAIATAIMGGIAIGYYLWGNPASFPVQPQSVEETPAQVFNEETWTWIGRNGEIRTLDMHRKVSEA